MTRAGSATGWPDVSRGTSDWTPERAESRCGCRPADVAVLATMEVTTRPVSSARGPVHWPGSAHRRSGWWRRPQRRSARGKSKEPIDGPAMMYSSSVTRRRQLPVVSPVVGLSGARHERHSAAVFHVEHGGCGGLLHHRCVTTRRSAPLASPTPRHRLRCIGPTEVPHPSDESCYPAPATSCAVGGRSIRPPGRAQTDVDVRRTRSRGLHVTERV